MTQTHHQQNHTTAITILGLCITVLAIMTTTTGIFSSADSGVYHHESVRGETIELYGKGLYKHMSADVAIQGIAQDYVTLFAGIPLLLISLWGYRRNSVRAHFVLSGTFGYFLVTFLFYTAMAMYNSMFLGYVGLLGLSFFGLFLTLWDFNLNELSGFFSEKTPHRFVGWFLMINAVLIAFLWLGIVVPPLLDSSVYPVELNHYTTLIVQGFDLGLLLPISFVSGFLLVKRTESGLLFGTVYIVFLAIMMCALTAKIIMMALHDVNIIPVIFIIPTITLITMVSAFLIVRSVSEPKACSTKIR